MIINQPLETVEMKDKFDFNIMVKGGGDTGQAGAIRLGVARVLLTNAVITGVRACFGRQIQVY